VTVTVTLADRQI